MAARQDPQAEVGTSQESQQSWFNASGYLHDTSTLQNSQILPVTEPSEFRYDRLQGSGEEIRSFGASANTGSRHEYQENVGDSWLSDYRQRVLLTFPEGEADAVTISERDMECLQPTEHLSNNIIDFYIKYLERKLSSEDRERFYFFNSFFFTKLLGNSSASNDIDQCKVDYEQVRKWSGEVNLFEKDYIFIPVLRSSHWSLIIICHLSSLWSNSSDTRKGSPCILHLDAVEGKHENFKRQIRSYISKAWMEKYHTPSDVDQLLDLCQLKYVQVEVPRQDNNYDCGLYLLHYVEVFLLQSTSPNFSFAARKRVPVFLRSNFARDVCGKRMAIRELILELSRASQVQPFKSMEAGNLSQELRTWLNDKVNAELGTLIESAMSGVRIEDLPRNGVCMFNESKHAVHPSTSVVAVDNNRLTEAVHTDHPTKSWESGVDTKPLNGVEIAHEQCASTCEVTMDRKQQSKEQPSGALLKPSKVTKKRKWIDEETWTLLDCKFKGGSFYKRNPFGTHWDNISQEIWKKHKTMPTGDQCRLRYDTLLKAYKTTKKFCMKTGKSFSEITKAESRELKLATTLSKRWYEAIDMICCRCPYRAMSEKRVKVSPRDDNGLFLLSPSDAAPHTPPAPACDPISAPAPAPPISAPTPIQTASSKPDLDASQRQVGIPLFGRLNGHLRSTLLNLIQASLKATRWTSLFGFGDVSNLEEACQWLAIVQDQQPSEIRKFIFKLLMLHLVNFIYNDTFQNGTPSLDLSNLRVHKKFLEKVLCKYPDFDIFLEVIGNTNSASFPNGLDSLSLQRIRVLSLYHCRVVECVDLSNFPELRFLAIEWCVDLRAVEGWEVVKKLGWLEISACFFYDDSPRLQCLPSLRELRYSGLVVPDFRQCVRLRRLEIDRNHDSWNSIDLSTLRFLEVLTFCNCSALTTIQGLSGLHFLTKLELHDCKALRGVPELGCLKALTHLSVGRSGVEEIAGVQELHLLTSLFLCGCSSLKRVPGLGHLKALARLYISWSSVEEIPGVEDLVSLERLDCEGSRLKRLPDLHHLRRLQGVGIGDTPLSRDSDPSSFYYGKSYMWYNSEVDRMNFVGEISYFSDTE